jgi:hypothetical protein
MSSKASLYLSKPWQFYVSSLAVFLKLGKSILKSSHRTVLSFSALALLKTWAEVIDDFFETIIEATVIRWRGNPLILEYFLHSCSYLQRE